MSAETVINAECFKKDWSSRKMSLWLDQLAQSFREQAALYLQQADLLDRMALACDKGEEYNPELMESSSSTEPLEQQLSRRNLISYASESASLMLNTHRKLDAIESQLSPWNSTEKKKKRKLRQKFGASSFSVFTKMHFDDLATMAGSRNAKIVVQEASKRWKGLSDSQKKVYIEAYFAQKKEWEKGLKADKKTKSNEKNSKMP